MATVGSQALNRIQKSIYAMGNSPSVDQMSEVVNINVAPGKLCLGRDNYFARLRIGCVAASDNSWSVNVKQSIWNDIVKELGKSNMDIGIYPENESLVLTQKKHRFNLNLVECELPEFVNLDFDPFCEINASEVVRLLSGVVHAAGTDNRSLVVLNDEFGAASTDNYRTAYNSYNNPGLILVSKSGATSLTKSLQIFWLGIGEDMPVKVYNSGSWIYLSAGNDFVFGLAMVSEAKPAIDNVTFPKMPFRARFDTKELRRALNFVSSSGAGAVSLFPADDADPITLEEAEKYNAQIDDETFGLNSMRLLSTTLECDARVDLICGYDGDVKEMKWPILLDGNFIRQGLAAMDDMVDFYRSASATHPVKLQDVTYPDRYDVIMPLSNE